jgi:threonine/homoserine/homoserine lactone efflux protein
LGLTLIFQTSSLAFLVVKYLGAFYLVYLGIKAWQDKNILSLQTPSLTVSSHQLFWQGVLSNVLNPKIAIFFLAFLPQFVDKAGRQVTLQLILLGLTFAFLGLLFLLIVGYSSGTIGSWITRRPAYSQFLGRVSGGILIGLGVRLALTERQ